jgi:RNA-directed DNA polymerase
LLLTTLARSILAAEPSADAIVACCVQTLGRNWRWLPPLARRYLQSFTDEARPRQHDVARFLAQDQGLHRAFQKYVHELSIAKWLVGPQQMRPAIAAREWKIPAIKSLQALADWLHLDISELQWFADLKGLSAKPAAKLAHYRYRVLAKQSGSLRLIEAPKPRLKEMQRQILSQILDNIPLHPSVHGFVKSRSIRTFAAPHVGRRVVLRMDLQDFFPSISGRRIQAFFRVAGYPETVADLLGGICTNAAPHSIWKQIAPGPDHAVDRAVDRTLVQQMRNLYARPHLPQGAATSPALANICAYRMDCRLHGLAQAAGAEYTRYADDLAFSGDESFEQCVDRFSIHVASIVHQEGFAVHHRKTRIMRRSVRQYLTGLVANEHLNIVRTDFDQLKAILYNCVRYGPESQNHEANPSFQMHLAGRIGFVESINPHKAERLRKLFHRIQW